MVLYIFIQISLVLILFIFCLFSPFHQLTYVLLDIAIQELFPELNKVKLYFPIGCSGTILKTEKSSHFCMVAVSTGSFAPPSSDRFLLLFQMC